MTGNAHANFAAAKAAAESHNLVVTERCEALNGAGKEMCLRLAGRTLAEAMAVATSRRDAALAAEERD